MQLVALVILVWHMDLNGRRLATETHGSDSESHCTSKAFCNVCKSLDVRLSMARVVDCYDNTMAELVFTILEFGPIECQPSGGFENEASLRENHSAYQVVPPPMSTTRGLGIPSAVGFRTDKLGSITG